jgi:hypothetical protein
MRNSRLTTLALLAAPLAASALDFTFFGRKPEAEPSRPVKVVSGVDPGVPVLFDMSSPEFIVLRAARADEHSTKQRAVYRFEWQKDGSARFYELANPHDIAGLDQQNRESTSDEYGKKTERHVLQTFLAEGSVLRTCLPPERPFIGTLVVYVVVGANGQHKRALVLPEGGVAECILSTSKSTSYANVDRPFTAKASIRITP